MLSSIGSLGRLGAGAVPRPLVRAAAARPSGCARTRPGGGSPSGPTGLLRSTRSARSIGPLSRETRQPASAGIFGVDEDSQHGSNAFTAPATSDRLPGASARVERRCVRRRGRSRRRSRLPAALALLCMLGLPLLAFLVIEQRLAGESTRWQRRDLPRAPDRGRATRDAAVRRLLARCGAQPARRSGQGQLRARTRRVSAAASAKASARSRRCASGAASTQWMRSIDSFRSWS